MDDLEHTYELSHAVVAFSLGYINANGEFIRFTNTTVMSNEIIESENKIFFRFLYIFLSFCILEEKSKPSGMYSTID